MTLEEYNVVKEFDFLTYFNYLQNKNGKPKQNLLILRDSSQSFFDHIYVQTIKIDTNSEICFKFSNTYPYLKSLLRNRRVCTYYLSKHKEIFDKDNYTIGSKFEYLFLSMLGLENPSDNAVVEFATGTFENIILSIASLLFSVSKDSEQYKVLKLISSRLKMFVKRSEYFKQISGKNGFYNLFYNSLMIAKDNIETSSLILETSPIAEVSVSTSETVTPENYITIYEKRRRESLTKWKDVILSDL